MISVKRINVFSKTHSWGKLKNKLNICMCVCILRLFVQECVRKAKEIKVRVAIGSEGKCQKFILMDKLYLLPACATNEKQNGRQLFCLHFLHANKCQEYFMHCESYAIKFGRHFFFFDHQTDTMHNVSGTYL